MIYSLIILSTNIYWVAIMNQMWVKKAWTVINKKAKMPAS